MGQQQLLLVVLVTIIVGIATVVALNVFSTTAEQVNRDAVRQDILTAAANAQSYYIRPDMLGGGGSSFEDMELEQLGIPGTLDENEVSNENGVYSFNGEPDGDEFTLVGEPSSSGDNIVATISMGDDDQWEIDWGDGGTTNGE